MRQRWRPAHGDKDDSMTEQIRIRVVPSIADIAATDWDACANPASLPRPANSAETSDVKDEGAQAAL